MRKFSYRVKGWFRFQHFKDRRPPWIKLYRDLLDDLEWHELDGECAKALISIWLIASENDGNLPEVKRLAFRLRMTEKACLSICSNLSHWLEQVDISASSARHQDDRLETETETEIETETEGETREQVRSPSDLKSTPPKKTASRQKGSRWPSEAVVPDEWVSEGEAYRDMANRPHIDLRAEALKFANYWSAKSGGSATKLDWKRTWLNWCLTANGGSHGSRTGKSQLEQLADIIGAEQVIDG